MSKLRRVKYVSTNDDDVDDGNDWRVQSRDQIEFWESIRSCITLTYKNKKENLFKKSEIKEELEKNLDWFFSSLFQSSSYFIFF